MTARRALTPDSRTLRRREHLPVINSPEIQVVNACRAGRGYIIFQFADPTDEQRSWVIGFEGVLNRST